MSYGLNSGWGGLIGDYRGFGGGPIKEYTTHLVPGLIWIPSRGCLYVRVTVSFTSASFLTHAAASRYWNAMGGPWPYR